MVINNSLEMYIHYVLFYFGVHCCKVTQGFGIKTQNTLMDELFVKFTTLLSFIEILMKQNKEGKKYLLNSFQII